MKYAELTAGRPPWFKRLSQRPFELMRYQIILEAVSKDFRTNPTPNKISFSIFLRGVAKQPHGEK
jgi:hypothetical protein